MKDSKIKLLIVSLISTFLFLILVAPTNAAIGIPIYIVAQIVLIYIMVPNWKIVLLQIPIILIALNFVFSANEMWRFTNVFVILIMYALIALIVTKKLNIKDSLLGFIQSTVIKLVEPMKYFTYPFEWSNEVLKDKSTVVKKVILGIVISIPILLILIGLLAGADLIFASALEKIFNELAIDIGIEIIVNLGISIAFGLYFFGFIYGIINKEEDEEDKNREMKSLDPLVLNIIIGSILVVYTLFMIIQFKYLFAQGKLPFGLTYAEYARKGFFELLFLTGINLVIIIYSTWSNKDNKILNKIFLNYLCTITCVLLVSSFYRMYLYSVDYGLTRLRLYVFGFLIFELIGLFITYFYINKAKINIVAVYGILCLSYYIILNVVPTDLIIAKNQVDRYFNGQRFEIEYLTSLSLDAAPQVERLLYDRNYYYEAKKYFEDNLKDVDNSWQKFNYSIYKAEEIHKKIKD